MHISPPADGRGHRFADPLLTSTARALGPRVIAIVLSGRLNGAAEGSAKSSATGDACWLKTLVSPAPRSPPAALAALPCEQPRSQQPLEPAAQLIDGQKLAL
jgi:hypothetical protein